ncbi:MAG: hypothetical protein ACTSVY_12050 [Candidatus Helarchaeota archaeon]
MAVETFFLFGFRALSDVIKEIFPPDPNNSIIKILEKYESKQISDENLIDIFEKSILKYKEVAFKYENLKFHIIKQLEPAFGHKVVINLNPMRPIGIEFLDNSDLIKVTWASQEDVVKSSGVSLTLEIAKKFLVEDLDVLKLITEGQIQLEKFEELNEIIVRALLGFTSAFFLTEDFQENVKKEMNAYINSLI